MKHPELLAEHFTGTASERLLAAVLSSPLLEAILARFQSGRERAEAHVEGVANPSVKTLILAALYLQTDQPMTLICPDAQTAYRYYGELQHYLHPDVIRLYPPEDFSPYDLGVIPVKTILERHRLLTDLKSGKRLLTLVTAKNIMLKHLSLEELDTTAIHLQSGDELSPEQLAQRCLELGYTRTGLILDPGEFSHRGDIFDLYPVNEVPVRIEFFGDTVETIREINVETQRSVAKKESVAVITRTGLVSTPERREALVKALDVRLNQQLPGLQEDALEALRTTVEHQMELLRQGLLVDGVDYYAPLVHQDFKTLIDYLPIHSTLVFDDWQLFINNLEGLSDRLDRQLEEGLAKGRLLDLGFQYHLNAADTMSALQTRLAQRLFLDTFPGEGEAFTLPLVAPDRFKADLRLAMEKFQALRRQHIQVCVTSDHPQRVLDACKEWDVPAFYTTGDKQKSLTPSPLDILVSKAGPSDGFILESLQMAHFTDTELFGRRLKKNVVHTRGRKREDVDVINSINDLRHGDYVVHIKHGIGRFVELSPITMDGETREYLTLQYSGSDRLHVPVDQVNQLTRYRGAGGDAAPKLNKMGGADWSNTRKKVQKSIQSIAKELTALYAMRGKVKGFTFEPDSPWQVEMEEAFPYTETPDQWEAIVDTKNDMESEKIMDRLICGDVGFGKTEVAIRAVFKAVLSGKQVALLVPTTILAQQHFNTLSDRFKPYPVKLGLLSRFRSPKEQKEVANRLSLGEVDVVVGTHRLLQKDIHFKDLGLVVIDEEQRFGVAHKEKLKQLRTEVDVLTLSATPIPRTLYMSLSGVREMSLINTPPINRSPVKTFVGPYNPAQIRMAVLQEIDRGGQIYFVHNRIQTIYEKAAELQALVPEADVVVGHGQMAEGQLEEVMLDFSQQKYDILLSTTIIESGLDIPSVNTIIIDNADRFGLAQLYQLRGRVGRSDLQAYAYLYYKPDRILTEDAKERLRAIREFTTLGSGYQIAMRDLEIRGVGNILGSEQHGHMISVGFDLYVDMLEEAIQELQGQVVEHREDSVIDLNVTAYMPDAWVGDRDVKMAEYKRLTGVKSEHALSVIMLEWKDRFGDIPWEAKQLVTLVRLRILATELGISMVRSDEEFLRISVPLSLQEWLKIQAQLPDEIAKKPRWVPGVASKQGSLAALLVKHVTMDGEAQLQFLETLFRAMVKIRKALLSAAGV